MEERSKGDQGPQAFAVTALVLVVVIIVIGIF